MGRRAAAAWVAGVLALTATAAGAVGPRPAAADTHPPVATTPATVSADALPTAQINGVVWSQVVVGNVVYAGGNFSRARPAGAAPGTGEVRRNGLLAYDIRTGVMTPWAPTLNGQVLAVAATPDHKRLYVAGEFTVANGVQRLRFAAFDVATGKLLAAVATRFNASVRAVSATNTAVYVGGTFTTVNGIARSRVAAIDGLRGGVLAWNAPANSTVNAIVAVPAKGVVVVGGRFSTLSGRAAYGLGAVDTGRGLARAFAANKVVRDAGVNSSITSLTTDGTRVYGTGYVFGRGGNFEGSFAALATTGAIVWLEDCHGDSYSGVAVGPVFYVVGHPHYCGNVGGFPEATPRVRHAALAFTNAATRKVAVNTAGSYTSFGGQPGPSLLTWYPAFEGGTFTGADQAAWSIAGNGSYLALGGEFPTVNGKPQQGLVRFAVAAIAPNKMGPVVHGASLNLTAAATAPGTVTLRWSTSWDRDNQLLTYTLLRDGLAAPVVSRTFSTQFWTSSVFQQIDSGLEAGHDYRYHVEVKDFFGNTVTSTAVTVTTLP
jgi:hypothetical protein